MSEMEPLITVAIPTRNRQTCAAVVIKAILDMVEDCQVVVNDNSDDDTLQSLIDPCAGDPRLSYRYFKETMSVVENFSSALSRATGQFVTFLGDDDIIGPRFIETVEWARKEGVEAVSYRSSGRSLHYFWPGVKSPRWGDLGGQLLFSRFSGKIADLDTAWSMRDAIFHLGNGPRSMPRLYLGIVSRELIERVVAEYGEVFGGFSPDVYSSHLLSTCCRKAAVVDYPIILPGGSPKSTSAQRAERSDVGGLTANDHLGRFRSIDWDQRIPAFYSPYTVWAQSHVMALKKTGRRIPLQAFANLYATILVFLPKLGLKELPGALKEHKGVVRRLWLGVLSVLAVFPVATAYVISKVPALVIGRPAGSKFVITGLPDVVEARKALYAALEKRGM